PTGNPPGALWKVVPASEVKSGQETAMTVQQVTQATAAASGAPQFRNTLNNQPLNMSLYPNETLTTEAIQFRRTGRNPYKGDTSAAASGRALYDQWCASCHLADGAGRIGPNLTDTTV